MSLISALLSLGLLTTSNTSNFDLMLNKLNTKDTEIILTNNIQDFEMIENYFYSNLDYFNNRSNGNISESLERSEVLSKLELEYPGYTWESTILRKTSHVSNGIPINVQTFAFPYDDIESAIGILELPTSYGGCGPIAMLGILDYFSRYLDYSEIITDPTCSSDRIQLAVEVLEEVDTYSSNPNQTSTNPFDYETGFNNLMSYYGLSNIISCSCDFDLFGDNKDYYTDLILDSIDIGLPVTLFGSPFAGDGDFSDHVTNIFGYEKFRGYNPNTNDTIEKDYIIGRLNFRYSTGEYYCDAGILNYPLMAVIQYNINYQDSYYAYASDFAEEFVNNNGGGQYFYYEISEIVELNNGRHLNTSRLRCSYIENQYLVLSPKRVDAGTSYLSIMTLYYIPKITFTASLWGPSEDHEHELFWLQYKKDNIWINHTTIDLSNMSCSKNYPDTYTILFPKETREIRFMATHSNPEGLRNRGRIVLNNFHFESNVNFN